MIIGNKFGVFRAYHLHHSLEKLSKNFLHSSQRIDIRLANHTADVETIIQLVESFVQTVPSDENCSSCDLLPQLWQRLQQRRDKNVFM
jgi:hypothetical protein